MNTREIEQAIAAVIIIANIDELDYETRKLRCIHGDMLTAWLPWPAEVGGNFIRWRPLRVGQQVVLASHAGDLTQAAIIGMLYSNEITPEETSEHIDVTEFNDGSKLRYDSENQTYEIIVAEQNVTVSKDEIKASFGGSASVEMNASQLKLTHGSSSITLDSTGVKINGSRIDFN
ncbi:phage baseplate assembly protein V [Marinomonas rhizomae]|uniref:phage baseplate assembly protein V n=1 Tax=Marinomonas rhizomae TaxID=491948 RepID=UPI002105AFDC|nr:phage baseplate assembly protein V [Marinomonas rhizomae]UTW01230.1 phage baseplate assembly protein V [Marinomonas rhizomae]